MRILTLALLLLQLGSAKSVDLRLVLAGPKEAVPLGEPFAYQVTLVNKTGARVRVVPIFFHSEDYLDLRLKSSTNPLPEVAQFAADFESGLNREDFVLLGDRNFIGQEFFVRPENPFEYIYGLREGTYSAQAVLHLHSFSSKFQWDDLPAVEATLSSNEITLTFGPPRPTTIDYRKRELKLHDETKQSQALAYFSSVRAPGVAAAVREILGQPADWLNRFHDPAGALLALRRNSEAANFPYINAALTSRFRDLAREALKATPPR